MKTHTLFSVLTLALIGCGSNAPEPSKNADGPTVIFYPTPADPSATPEQKTACDYIQCKPQESCVVDENHIGHCVDLNPKQPQPDPEPTAPVGSAGMASMGGSPGAAGAGMAGAAGFAGNNAGTGGSAAGEAGSSGNSASGGNPGSSGTAGTGGIAAGSAGATSESSKPNLTVGPTEYAPSGGNIPCNSSAVIAHTFAVSTGSQPVTITDWTIPIHGTGDLKALAGVYLLDQVEQRISESATIEVPSERVVFHNLNLTIPAYTVQVLHIAFSLDETKVNLDGSYLFWLENHQENIITTEPANIGGWNPYPGGMLTVKQHKAATAAFSASPMPNTVVSHGPQREISRFKMAVSGGDIGQSLYHWPEIKMQLSGTDLSQLKNFKIYRTDGDSEVSWALLAYKGHLGILLTGDYLNGTTTEFRILADIDAPSGATIRASIPLPVDAGIDDKLYVMPAHVCVSESNPGCAMSGANFDGTGTGYTEVTVE